MRSALASNDAPYSMRDSIDDIARALDDHIRQQSSSSSKIDTQPFTASSSSSVDSIVQSYELTLSRLMLAMQARVKIARRFVFFFFKVMREKYNINY